MRTWAANSKGGPGGGASAPTLVSALPGSPTDGQEIYLLVDGANGIIWHLRYRAASASAYKWEYLGGVPLTAFSVAGDLGPQGVATYGDFTTNPGPSVTLPAGVGGDFLLRLEATMLNDSSGPTFNAYVSVALGATAPSDNNCVQRSFSDNTPRGGDLNMTRTSKVTGVSAGALLKVQARTDAASTSGVTVYARRLIELRPIRVG